MNRKLSRFDKLVFGLRELAGTAMVAGILLAMRGDAAAEDKPAEQSKVIAYLRVGDVPAVSGSQFRNPAEYEAYRKTQAARIKSPLVLQNAIRKLSEDPQLTVLRDEREPQRWMEDHINVTAPLEQELIQISLSDVEPQQAVKIVNAVCDSYLDNVVNSEVQQVYQKYNLLQKDLRQLRDDLGQKQQMLAELSRRNSELTKDGETAREHNSNLERLLTTVRERRLEIDLQAAAAKTRLSLFAADSPEAAKAKIDLAVAEAQQEVLKHAKDELTSEMERAAAEAIKSVQATADVAALKVTIADLQKAVAKREDEVCSVRLQLDMPPRVQALERATVIGQ
jgi:predicted  nucleic acid-binding Zn-ribbon protein